MAEAISLALEKKKVRKIVFQNRLQDSEGINNDKKNFNDSFVPQPQNNKLLMLSKADIKL